MGGERGGRGRGERVVERRLSQMEAGGREREGLLGGAASERAVSHLL